MTRAGGMAAVFPSSLERSFTAETIARRPTSLIASQEHYLPTTLRFPLRDVGADEFVDYTKTNAEDVVRDADLVVDAAVMKMARFPKK